MQESGVVVLKRGAAWQRYRRVIFYVATRWRLDAEVMESGAATMGCGAAMMGSGIVALDLLLLHTRDEVLP